MATGVAGLDLVLNGGLEPGAVVVVAGAPGTGKTILAQQICFATGTAGHKCVYYTTVSEPHTKLVRHLEPFTFFDPAALGSRVEHIHLGDFLRPARPDGLEPLVSEIVRKTLEEEPAVVVVDSAKMLRDFADERELRGALYDLTGRFAETGTVLLLVGEYTPEELGSGVEFSLADGIIQLEYQAREPVDRRTLRIAKMRGGRHLPGRHTFQIGPDGVDGLPAHRDAHPRRRSPPVSGPMRSGIPGLDELMGGGVKQGDATPGHRALRRRQDNLRAALDHPGGEGGRTLPLRHVPGHRRSAHSAWPPPSAGTSAPPRPPGNVVDLLRLPMGDLDLDVLANAVRAELSEHPIRRIAIDSLAELVLAARE